MNNNIYLDEIANRLFTGHASIMVGSGFSKNAIAHGESCSKFSDWKQLGDVFYKKLHGENYNSNNDVKYLNVLKLAEEVEATFGRPVLDEILKQNIPDTEYEPSELHKELLELPWTDIFTTNYDTLLERASKNIFERKYTTVVTKEDLVYASKPRIIKLHGSFNSIRPFIITEEDYRLYPINNAPFVNTVQQSLLENTLCLIGFSGDDPNFLNWIGWIRDNLKSNVSKIYLIGALNLTNTQIKLLEKRNIIPINLCKTKNEISAKDHYEAIENFIDYLSDKAKTNNLKLWPYKNCTPRVPKISEDNFEKIILNITKEWQEQKSLYPGWIIMPSKKRQNLFFETEDWLEIDFSKYKILNTVKASFIYELVWRLDNCLYPLNSTLCNTIEELLLDKEMDTNLKNSFIFSLLKYYRQNGNDTKWNEYYNLIKSEKALSIYQKGELDYEIGLYYLFSLDYTKLKEVISDWTFPKDTPFQNSKKAGILAEIGQLEKALEIEENALINIRIQESLLTSKANYNLLSQEAYILYLYFSMRQSFIRKNDIDYDKYAEREFFLDNYLCSPNIELNHFRDILSSEYKQEVLYSEEPSFDIGIKYSKYKFGYSYQEETNAFKFLIFCEKTGYPFYIKNIGNMDICGNVGKNAVIRIRNINLFWAISAFCRIADTNKLDTFFNRKFICEHRESEVISLCEKLIKILTDNSKNLQTIDSIANNFSTTLASILPEIISRLCTKIDTKTKINILKLLNLILSSECRMKYINLNKLIERFMISLSNKELNEFLLDILKLPIPKSYYVAEKNLFSPLFYIKNDIYIVKKIDINNLILIPYFEALKSKVTTTRRWSCTTLLKLYELKLLNDAQVKEFNKLLWTKLDNFGFPTDTNYLYSSYLILPHPSNINEKIDKYITSITFINSKKSHIISSNDISSFESYTEDVSNLISTNNFPKKYIIPVITKLLDYWENNISFIKRDDLKNTFIKLSYAIQDIIVFLKIKGFIKESTPHINNFIEKLNLYKLSTLSFENAFHTKSLKNIMIQIRFNLTSNDMYYRNNVLQTSDDLYQKSSDTTKNCLLNMLINSLIYDTSPLISLNIGAIESIIKQEKNEEVIKINCSNIVKIIQYLNNITKYSDNTIHIEFEEKVNIRQKTAIFIKTFLNKFENAKKIPEIQNIITDFTNENEFAEIKNILIDL